MIFPEQLLTWLRYGLDEASRVVRILGGWAVHLGGMHSGVYSTAGCMPLGDPIVGVCTQGHASSCQLCSNVLRSAEKLHACLSIQTGCL